MKIVINKCYGGFGVSDKAFKRLIELGMKVTTYDEYGNYRDEKAEIIKFNDKLMDSYYGFTEEEKVRTDPRLIQVIEELGDGINDDYSELEIVEIPDGVEWQIQEYDGVEWIAEKHRVWN